MAKGYKDVRATSNKEKGDDSEPLKKKLKGDDEDWENIVFLRTNFNDSKLLAVSNALQSHSISPFLLQQMSYRRVSCSRTP